MMDDDDDGDELTMMTMMTAGTHILPDAERLHVLELIEKGKVKVHAELDKMVRSLTTSSPLCDGSALSLQSRWP